MSRGVWIRASFFALFSAGFHFPSSPGTGAGAFSCERVVLQDAEEKEREEEEPSLQAFLQEIEKWPSIEGRRAAHKLIFRGKEVLSPVVKVLRESSDDRSRCAAAYIIGRIGGKEHFDVIKEVLDIWINRTQLKVFFEAMGQLDPERAVPVLLDFTRSNHSTVRSQAAGVLSGLLKPNHLPLVKVLMKENNPNVRNAVLQLYRFFPREEIVPELFRALEDPSAPVAYQAASMLAEECSPKVSEGLIRMVRDSFLRHKGYATLSLVMMEDNHSNPVLEASLVPLYLRLLAAEDYFAAGCAAIALVNLGYRIETQELTHVLDKAVVPALLGTLGSDTYFKDFTSLVDLGFQKLHVITGEHFGRDIDAWREWWFVDRERFQARRGLFSLDDRALEKVKVKLIEKNGDPSVLFCGSLEEREGEALVISKEDMKELLRLLRASNLFRGVPGIPVDGVQRRKIRMEAENQACEFDEESVEAFRAMEEEILRLQKDYLWQIFWDSNRFPDRVAWWNENWSWWVGGGRGREKNDSPEGRRRLTEMVLSSLDNIPEKRRVQGLSVLAGMEDRETILADADILLLLEELYSGDLKLNACTDAIVRVLAGVKRKEVSARLLAFLRGDYSRESKKLMEEVLKTGGRERIFEALQNESWQIRSAAADSLAGERDGEVQERLKGLLSDPNPNVVVSALRSIAQGIAPEEAGSLFFLLKSEDPLLVQEVVGVLGRTGGEGVIERLKEVYSRKEGRIREAVVSAMVNLRGKDSSGFLLSILKEKAPLYVKREAAYELGRRGGERIRKELRAIAAGKFQQDSSLLAMEVLGRWGGAENLSFLEELLSKETREEVILRLGLILAWGGRGDSFPYLLDLLEKSREKAREAVLLASCRDLFGGNGEAAALQYRSWWETKKGSSPWNWFLEALEEEGIQLDEGLKNEPSIENREAIRLLITALGDRRWYIRFNAAVYLDRLTGEARAEALSIPSPEGEGERVKEWWLKWWERNKR